MQTGYTLSVFTALSLAFAMGGATAAEPLNRRGAVPMVGSGGAAKPVDTITPGSSYSGAMGAMQAPRAVAAPKAPAMTVDGLAGLKHSRDGTDTEVEAPARVQRMLRARGKIGAETDTGAKGKLVRIKNTQVSPYASMGMVMSGCSGALVMKRFVLTAPWCVYDVKAKKFYENLDFVPALNGDSAPVGTVKWKNVWIPKGFRESGDLAYAFAMIELEQDIGDQVGWFGFGPVKGSEQVKQLALAGYPFADGIPPKTLWEANCKIDANEPNAYFYRCPGKGKTLVGMLGGPFYMKGAKEGDAGQLLGIHVTSQDDKLNSWWAMKLNAAHTQTILGWANEGVTPDEPDEPAVEEEEESEEETTDAPACTCEEDTEKAEVSGEDEESEE